MNTKNYVFNLLIMFSMEFILFYYIFFLLTSIACLDNNMPIWYSMSIWYSTDVVEPVQSCRTCSQEGTTLPAYVANCQRTATTREKLRPKKRCGQRKATAREKLRLEKRCGQRKVTARDKLLPEKSYGQRKVTARETLRPEKSYGQRIFAARQSR